MVKVLVVTDDVRGEQGHVARSHILARVRFAPRVGEMRMRHAEFVRAFVHHISEMIFRAADTLGQCHRRVVSRLDQESAQEVLDSHVAVDREERCGAVRVRSALSPGLLGHLEDIVQVEAAFLQLAKNDFRGEQLGRRSGRRGLIGVLLIKDRAGVIVLDQRDLRGGRECFRARRAVDGQKARGEERETEPDESQGISYDASSRSPLRPTCA